MSTVLVWAEPAKVPAIPAKAIVAIGDVHGDFDDFVGILQRTGLIDKQNHWNGGNATFVQLGDLLDRGPKPRDVMDLMMALEKEAAQSGGRGVSLLGNHEAMNIMGDKLSAKAAAKKYNIPMVPGTDGAIDNVEKAKKTAAEV